MKKTLTIVLILAALIIGMSLLMNQNSAPSQSSTDNSTTVATTTSSDTSGKTFTITGSDFSFSPSNITAQKGDRIKIIFVNSVGNHNLVIDEFGVATPIIRGGKQADIEFTADKTGTFKYYCSVGEHRALGMEGTLTVQ